MGKLRELARRALGQLALFAAYLVLAVGAIALSGFAVLWMTAHGYA
ncbi:hypothetical protein [Micromonospora sp. NPDC048839]